MCCCCTLQVKMGSQQKRFTYEELVEHVFGRVGYYSVVVSMWIFAYGAMLA